MSADRLAQVAAQARGVKVEDLIAAVVGVGDAMLEASELYSRPRMSLARFDDRCRLVAERAADMVAPLAIAATSTRDLADALQQVRAAHTSDGDMYYPRCTVCAQDSDVHERNAEPWPCPTYPATLLPGETPG